MVSDKTDLAIAYHEHVSKSQYTSLSAKDPKGRQKKTTTYISVWILVATSLWSVVKSSETKSLVTIDTGGVMLLHDPQRLWRRKSLPVLQLRPV